MVGLEKKGARVAQTLPEPKSFPAPRCPECDGKLEVLREYIKAPWIAICENGHLCDASFDWDAREWTAVRA